MTALNALFSGQSYESSSALSSDNRISVFLKSKYEAFLYRDYMLTKITDADYPGWSQVTPTSITRSGSTATVTLPSAVNWQTGSKVTIAGATQTQYNGEFVISVTDSTHFTYKVTGTPATPATGTITAKGGRTTVPGIAYLDGYFFVMDENAVIYNCALGSPTSWNALDFISANIEPGAGVAIAKSQNYVIAMKSWSTEFFYDAGNAVGSPLDPVLSAFTLVGCASGESVASIEGTIAWVSKTRQKGRSVHVMNGLQQQKVSTPDVERILNADNMQNIYAYGLKVSGHSFYVLGLRNSNLTLVYDITSDTWSQWTTIGPNLGLQKVMYLQRYGGNLYVQNNSIWSPLNLQLGDTLYLSGSTNEFSDPMPIYDGIYTVLGFDGVNVLIGPDPAPWYTGIATSNVAPIAETYFKYTRYVFSAGKDLLLHETTGALVEIKDGVYQDEGFPIATVIRTGKLDLGNEDRKTIGQIRVIGNKVGGPAMIRWSDDDYTTFSTFRTVDLSSEQARLTRCGSFRRRSFELRHVANSPVQVAALELEINQEK